MAHIAMTGGNGFLGWHTRMALLEQSLPTNVMSVGNNFSVESAAAAMSGASRAIHIAGVNRANDDAVKDGNLLFAEQFAEALHRAEIAPPVVVYANSTHSRGGSVYGEAKMRAAEIVAEAARSIGADFVDVMLPNLFGEHGKPFYNAVTATFCHLLAAGERPLVENDKELTLMHAQNAADLLTGATSISSQSELEVHETVSGLLTRLGRISETYARGEIPDISSDLDRDLFNTYRSHTFESLTPISLTRHADVRGSFFEIIRSHGGTGQSSFSTTAPGISRGDHFHRRKVERFTVLAGEATISLRKLFTSQIYDFCVTGESPMAIDMPTGWSHKIENTSDEVLYTSFWTNDIFDPAHPDTISEAV